MSYQNSNYHRFLRVAAVVCAFVLVFESGLISQTTSEISKEARQYLVGAVGMSASVEPTELNQITAALTQKERELAMREASLAEREIAVGITDYAPATDRSSYLLASILFILLLLILLNYALDFLRSRERAQEVLRPV